VRIDNRKYDELREIKVTRHFTDAPHGSVLMEYGNTKVICTAIIEDGVPPFLTGSGQGWVTAEYAMLPAASPQRKQRESRRGKPDGRSLEIGRLVGRSLRAITEMKNLGARTIWIDCDVLQADGGTRTAAITGGYIALHDAIKKLCQKTELRGWPIKSNVAAVSVGIVNQEILLDLNYHEDSRAEVDMNIVKTSAGEYIEVQGGAEKKPFNEEMMQKLLDMGQLGISQLIEIQNNALGVEQL